jgi:hypothetical protein
MSNFTDFISSGGDGFEGVRLSGTTQTMDLSQGNYFIGGTLDEDTTLAFSNVPTDAEWSYSAIAGGAPATLTLPSSIRDTELEPLQANKRINYTFTTVDSGTNVSLVKQEVLP